MLYVPSFPAQCSGEVSKSKGFFTFPNSVSSDDDEGNNPLVTGFQDDVDPEDVVPSRAVGDPVPVLASKDSSDEEDTSVVQGKDPNQGESFLLWARLPANAGTSPGG